MLCKVKFHMNEIYHYYFGVFCFLKSMLFHGYRVLKRQLTALSGERLQKYPFEVMADINCPGNLGFCVHVTMFYVKGSHFLVPKERYPPVFRKCHQSCGYNWTDVFIIQLY